jgi:hypothetical protein
MVSRCAWSYLEKFSIEKEQTEKTEMTQLPRYVLYAQGETSSGTW